MVLKLYSQSLCLQLDLGDVMSSHHLASVAGADPRILKGGFYKKKRARKIFADHAHFKLNHTHIFENKKFFLDAFSSLANTVGKVELEISL